VSAVASSREFLARYCDAKALALHDLICHHDDGRLGAPPFIVEPSVKFDQRDGSVSKNRFSIVVKQPKQALDITADLFAQGWIAPRFHEEITVFVMKGVLKKGIFAFGLDFSAQRIVKLYTEYKAKDEAGVLQARIDGIAVVDDAAVKLKHYVQLDRDIGYQAAVAGLKYLQIDKRLVDVVYGVSLAGVMSEYHIVLNTPLQHAALDAVISVVTVKAHELTLYLRSNKA
jgi:hypothetical protein